MVLGRRYRLVEPIGTGGMAVVWRAYDQVLHRTVAVKMLAPQPAHQQDGLRLLRAEALAVASLAHPHITSVHDYGQQRIDGREQPYLVMELVEGVTLRQLLHDAPGGLDGTTAASIVAQTAAALAAAHARGIVHRDVTPSNIMLTADGVKVLDFGICVLAGFDDGQDDELVGTVDYIAPERITGRSPVTAACDVYALGVILYRCLSGRLPWHAGPPAQRLREHVFTAPDPLPPVAGLPPAVLDLCLRCLAKDPADRPSAAEIAVRLGRSHLAPGMAPAADDGERTRLLAMPTEITRPAAERHGGVSSRLATSIRTMPPRRRAGLSAGAVTIAGLLGVVLLNTGADHAGATEVPAEACSVTYEIRAAGAAQDAALSVRTSHDRPAPWRLAFTSGDQPLLTGDPVSLHQADGQVVITGAAGLRAGEPFTVRLTGPADASGAPARFQLDDTVCQSSVSVFSAVPSPVVVVEPAPAARTDHAGKPAPPPKGKNKGKGKHK